MDQFSEIVEAIKNNTIKENEYFSIAQCINSALVSKEEAQKVKARNVVIYILEYWDNVPHIYRQLFTDIIASCGFFPYLEKDKDKLVLNNLKQEIRKEMHRSNYIKSDMAIYFHEAQNELRELLLNTDRNIVVSAPTSFGKSLLIEEIVASEKYENIVIIQPTLALLNETRNNLRKYDDVYQIIIRVSDQPKPDIKHLFLLTAERVMEYKNLPHIDLFILDEFYKISQKRADDRYEVLNNACNKMLNFHKSRFYFLGPNIDSISQEFIDKYNVVFKKYNYSLVVNEEEQITNGTNYYQDRQVEIKEQRLFQELLKIDGQTIIYCSSPDKSTSTAINFAKYLENTLNEKQNSPEDMPLIAWIRDNISYKWDILLCLKHSVGLHNGAFPKHINSSIIDYFNNGKLKYLFCTSTIIEGVNTSAKNVIIYNNWRGKTSNKIDYFDYKNIKGRSGRLFKHYIGVLYNFYPKLEEQEIKVDIPFIDQEKPLNKEILAQTLESDIKDKNSKEYLELMQIPKDELELYKFNGITIEGQKYIHDYIKENFANDYSNIYWSYMPTYKQVSYITNLCFEHLLKSTETTNGMTDKKLATLIHKCNQQKSLATIIRNEVKYYCEEKGEDYNKILISAFQIQRHWFDYKVPKWFGVFNEIQKFICNKNNVPAGDYSYFISMIENDYISNRASILLEFDLPITAIKTLDALVPQYVEADDFLRYIKENQEVLLVMLPLYEQERLKREIL